MAKKNKKVLVYQLYALSWRHCGGIKAMTKFLYRIAALDVDVIWVSGILASPQYDHGYDISDYRKVDPVYGSMEDFREFTDTAHQLGMKVIIDLVLNHTSVQHPWFREHPDYYCWSYSDRPGWRNLFDDESAWKYDGIYDQYYCHLFHESQADLNWFSDGDEVNTDLVYEFKANVRFWLNDCKIDGFRLDVPQAINKDLSRDNLEFSDLLYRDEAIKILNAIFPPDGISPFLMMEIFDPTFGSIIEYYTNNTAINFGMNVLLKKSALEGLKIFRERLYQSVANPKFMADTESHDSPRCSYKYFDPMWFTHQLFVSDASAICLYQGQELGLSNPTKDQLSDTDMLRLDAQTAMQYAKGKSLDELRPTSRANARVPLPFDEYEYQERASDSYLNLIKLEIKAWRT